MFKLRRSLLYQKTVQSSCIERAAQSVLFYREVVNQSKVKNTWKRIEPIMSAQHPNSVIIPDDEIDLNTLSEEQHDQRLAAMLDRYWDVQNRSMDVLKIATEQEFKNHNDLPLARIKRIMKSDEDVRMISAEAPVLFAKACELFILDLSIRAWGAAEKTKRRTLQKEDVDAAIANTDVFDFLRNL